MNQLSLVNASQSIEGLLYVIGPEPIRVDAVRDAFPAIGA
jgi:hypothetical protein